MACMFLLGIQSSSAEAAEYTEQELQAIENEEWKQYVEKAEEYTLDNVQTLENGLVAVTYEKENCFDNGVMLLSSTVSKSKTINFYAGNVLVMTFLEESTWSYSGTGSKPSLKSVTYGARYANWSTGLASWSTPQMINLKTETNKATYCVQVTLTFGGGIGDAVYISDIQTINF